ncbi:MAG: response regulator [Anaerolineae bacterium]
MSHNTAAIRELLKVAFSDQDLMIFCHDYFHSVYDKFASEMSRLWKIQLLIDHCEKYDQFDELLTQIQDINPEQWAKIMSSIKEPSQTSEVDISASKDQVEITLIGDLTNFTPELQFAVVGALAGVLNIPRDQIDVLNAQAEGIILQLEMPTEAINQLIGLYEANDPVIQDLGIQQVRIIYRQDPQTAIPSPEADLSKADQQPVDKIKVLLADDHSLFREGIRSLLEDQDDIEIVGEAEDGLEAVQLAETLIPTVILMDINMPVVDGVEAARMILGKNSSIGIIILTMYPQDEYILEVLKAGAKAYLLKDTRSKRLLEVIRTVHAGQAVIDTKMTTRLLSDYKRLADKEDSLLKLQPLTDQERRILTLVAYGASNRDIATDLNLSERTIKNYLSVIFQKLQVNNRTEAAIRAVRDGLVEKM